MKAHFAAIFEHCSLDSAPIDEGPIYAPEIFERVIARLRNNTRVALRDRRVLDDELVVERSAYLDVSPVENIGYAPFTIRRDRDKVRSRIEIVSRRQLHVRAAARAEFCARALLC